MSERDLHDEAAAKFEAEHRAAHPNGHRTITDDFKEALRPMMEPLADLVAVKLFKLVADELARRDVKPLKAMGTLGEAVRAAVANASRQWALNAEVGQQIPSASEDELRIVREVLAERGLTLVRDPFGLVVWRPEDPRPREDTAKEWERWAAQAQDGEAFPYSRWAPTDERLRDANHILGQRKMELRQNVLINFPDFWVAVKKTRATP